MSYLYQDKRDTDVNFTVDHSVEDMQQTLSLPRNNGMQKSPPLPMSIEKQPLNGNASNSSHPCTYTMKNKSKRKIDSENSLLTPIAIKKIRENGYLSAAKLNHVVVQLPQLDGMIDIYAEEEPEPVTCVQCHRTYRTTFSYERHLDTCSSDFSDFMISSCESDSVSSEEDKLSGYGASTKILSLETSPIIDIAPVNSTLTNKYTDTYIAESDEKLVGAMPTFANNITTNMDVNSVLYPCTAMAYEDAHFVNNVLPRTVTLVQNVKQDTVGVVSPQPISLPIAAADPAIKFTIVDNSGKISTCNADYNTQFAAPHSYSIQNVSATPTYVIQQPYQKPTEIIPTFVTLDNMQPLQQIQLQPLAPSSVNFQPVVPTILSAVVQPNIIETTPTTTYIVNASAPGDIYTPQNVLLPSQPVIFGMETVVSNTVMSSSHQFMTQSLSGANIGSSTLYSTTTTQVFQAAKQLPPQSPSQPELSSGYILLNTPVSSQDQSSIQTIQTMPAFREMEQHTEPQVTVVSGTLADKYMYLHNNNNYNSSVSQVLPKKLPPVIVKPAVKPLLPAKKNTKVMKVKNNRPIAIQTADNVIRLASSTLKTRDCIDREEVAFGPNVKNLQIKTTNKTVLCGHSGHDAKPVKTTPLYSNNGEMKTEQNLQYKRTPEVVVDSTNVSSLSCSSDNAPRGINIADKGALAVAYNLAVTGNVFQTSQLSTDATDVDLDKGTAASRSGLFANVTNGIETTVENQESDLPIKLDIDQRAGTVANGKKVLAPDLNKSLLSTDLSTESASTILNGKKIAPAMKILCEQNSPSIAPSLSPNSSKDNFPPITLNNKNIAGTPDISENVNKLPLNVVQEENNAQSMPLLNQLDPVCVHNENSIDHCTTSSALLTEPVRRKYVPKIVFQKPETIAPKNMPLLDSAVRSTSSETDKIFDELVRQHKLSLKNKSVTKDNSSIVNLKSRDGSMNKPQVPKKTTIMQVEPAKKSKKDPDAKEKENLTSNEKSVEDKCWKTASFSFEVNAEDGFSYKTNDLHDLWTKILESVQHSRNEYKLPLLPKNALVNAESVYSLLGFENKASKYLLEQLPDAWKCIFYKPVFHNSPLYGKTSPVENVSGCARTEPFTSSHKFDMFGWLASRHRKPPKFMMVSDSDIVNGNR